MSVTRQENTHHTAPTAGNTGILPKNFLCSTPEGRALLKTQNPDEGMTVSLSVYQNKLQQSTKYQDNLSQLLRDGAKFMLFSQDALEQQRHVNSRTQHAYDTQRGLIILP